MVRRGCDEIVLPFGTKGEHVVRARTHVVSSDEPLAHRLRVREFAGRDMEDCTEEESLRLTAVVAVERFERRAGLDESLRREQFQRAVENRGLPRRVVRNDPGKSR